VEVECARYSEIEIWGCARGGVYVCLRGEGWERRVGGRRRAVDVFVAMGGGCVEGGCLECGECGAWWCEVRMIGGVGSVWG
jgi:hypothetical protein